MTFWREALTDENSLKFFSTEFSILTINEIRTISGVQLYFSPRCQNAVWAIRPCSMAIFIAYPRAFCIVFLVLITLHFSRVMIFFADPTCLPWTSKFCLPELHTPVCRSSSVISPHSYRPLSPWPCSTMIFYGAKKNSYVNENTTHKRAYVP